MTLDTWRPTYTPPTHRIPGEWRKNANRRHRYPQLPGADDVRKIKGYIRRGVPHTTIMHIFNITEATLYKIAKDCYNAISSANGYYESSTRHDNKIQD